MQTDTTADKQRGSVTVLAETFVCLSDKGIESSYSDLNLLFIGHKRPIFQLKIPQFSVFLRVQHRVTTIFKADVLHATA